MKLYHSIMVLSVAIAVWILVQAYGSFVTTSHAPTSRRIDQRYVYFRAMHGSMIKAGIRLGNSMLHRYLIDAPDGYHVDHINHNTLDNRKENLRVVTHLANNLNREDLVGSIPQRGDKFLPSITYRGRTYHLGTFDDFSHAAAARVAAKKLILQIDQDLRDGQYECC